MSIDDLGRHLYWLETDGDLLDDLLVPRQPTSGENAGRPPQRGKSKPPVVLGVVDLKAEVEEVLGYWCGQLVASVPDLGPPTSSRRIAARAGWLRGHTAELFAMPWAEMMADEVASRARLVRDVVSPPARASDPEPIEEGTTREIESWLRLLGVPASRASLRRWIDAGDLEYRMLDDGRRVVRLADAVELAKRRRFSGGPPSVVS